jgi:hypothetical protein
MKSISSNTYHCELAQALDASSMAAHHSNNSRGKTMCLQHWAAPQNNSRIGHENLPPGVIQLIHCMTTFCYDSDESTGVKCFCIKVEPDENKNQVARFFYEIHKKGSCPHKVYQKEFDFAEVERKMMESFQFKPEGW